MADIRLTQAQQAVVDNRGGALLVSAAAGSGKTKVLVDRLLSRICDPESPCNIDDFLVITYTNAAAAELRLKIAQALNKRLAEEPENKHLQRQMSRIYMAEISTVHAFCSGLIRTYAHVLDIPGDFRMIEEPEAKVLQTKVLDVLLEQGYEECSEDFRIMVETFGYGRDDSRLPQAILMANRAMRCRADMKRWVEQTLGMLDISRYGDVMETPWGAYIVQEYRAFVSKQIDRLSAARAEMLHYPVIDSKYGETFERNIEQLKGLLEAKTWDDIVAGLSVDFGKLKPVRSPEDVSVKERLKNLRNKCLPDIKKWQQMFYADSQELLKELGMLMPGAQALIRFAVDFDAAYAEEKKRRKLLDFSDLEHLAIRLLTDRYTGKPTAVAEEVSRRFEEIMVDEYQDSNQVQEVIFEAISRGGKNRFMVGDVKQSIYRFRLADPKLFLKKYETYPSHLDAKAEGPRKIILSENFRSRPEVLAACNDVFRLIMRKAVGDLDYGDEESLRAGRTFPALPQTPVELHCLTNTDREHPVDKRDLEAEFVAARIRKMLDEKMQITNETGDGLRTVRPGDIVILMRAVSSNARSYLQALERYGIPAVCDRGGDLLETTEVQILTSMLQVVNDPHQDIPLLTVMASPVFGFSPDQLAQARTKMRKGSYFEAISAFGGPFEEFLKLIERLRDASVWLSVHELIEIILHETDLLAVFSAMPDGEQREKNISAFREFVVGTELNGSRALAQLLRYLEDMRAAQQPLPQPQSASENAVTIMTVHRSKGLEFPVVFLCDLSHKFNMTDMQDAILVDDDLAVGCDRIDAARYIRYPTLAKKSIEWKKRAESVSEELRVLYVAMTRAKDMLVMTYYSKFLLSELNALNSQMTMPLSDDLCAGVSDPGKWILLAALCRTEAGELLTRVEGNDVAQVSQYPWVIGYHDLKPGPTPKTMLEDSGKSEEVKIDPTTLRWLGYRYPHADVSSVPAKLTATQLKGRVLDHEAAEGAAALKQESAYRFRKAAFLQRELTAAEKGTAAHLFMQFARYDRCATEDGLKAELERLCREQFLTQAQADAIELEKLAAFFRSETGQWLLSRKDLYREFKFSVMVDADRYVGQGTGEQMMLQGVVDCFAVDDDGITILDFKTDRVSGDISERAEYYRPQMEAYAEALTRIFELPVKRKMLYFFYADRAVSL